MDNTCQALLVKLADNYDQTGNRDVDSMFYFGFPDHLLDFLESLGYIRKFNDIIGTIELTDDGYRAVRR